MDTISFRKLGRGGGHLYYLILTQASQCDFALMESDVLTKLYRNSWQIVSWKAFTARSNVSG